MNSSDMDIGFDAEDMDEIHKAQEADQDNPYWEYYGDYPDGIITGKFLFFSEDRDLLIDILHAEIDIHGFFVGKVSKDQNNGRIGDHVLCLYSTSNQRGRELSNRYKALDTVKYRWWKSNADTAAGKYSEQFKKGIAK
jgi:hypothetical protein